MSNTDNIYNILNNFNKIATEEPAPPETTRTHDLPGSQSRPASAEVYPHPGASSAYRP